ncbi:trypsin-like peptidase domain-containing protein [Macrococcus caseolyticus]|uniref:S1C family serine protease n=1 Tax=Macrococcoides caseolyticum TaxID=69966 RepID=UPI0021B470B8|nr:trypsin-like peptidase domain-containing protein [Macrococcus caseolyticus]MDJ1088008.1 trypsin-like peptidase domain-containing protein [Macrococcus caseolyticus]MDJ1090674.1 trypsin-like peptidase domain-containing protein [Macrococcus caseolyticus]MDJ1155434.1 trypsin-like peptidase domain-containing protein [Macrococcus caseolyticus]
MEQNNEYYNKDSHLQTQHPKKQNAGFLKMVLAGVVGSVLTLGVTELPEYFSHGETETISPVTVDNTTTSKSTSNLSQMLEQVSPAIVGVINMQQAPSSIYDILSGNRSTNITPAGTGSGVIYQVDGNNTYIVTNNHVVEGAKELKVKLSNGKTIDAELMGTDALTDIAVLKVQGQLNIKPVAFADSSKIRIGEPVYAIGNPLGLELAGTVTEGIVSSKERTMKVETSAGNASVKVIQTDAAINPGNSGGALINTSGQLIGINSMKISANQVEGIGFAIPSNDTKTIIEQLVKNGKVERPYMGLGLVGISDVPADYLKELKITQTKGVVVAQTDSVSRTKFNKGDVITAINGHKVESDSDVRNYIYTHHKAGDNVKFTVYREDKKTEVTMTLRSTNNK